MTRAENLAISLVSIEIISREREVTFGAVQDVLRILFELDFAPDAVRQFLHGLVQLQMIEEAGDVYRLSPAGRNTLATAEAAATTQREWIEDVEGIFRELVKNKQP